MSESSPIALRRSWLATVDGRLVAGCAALIALLLVVLARSSLAAFGAIALAGLVVVGYAAHRWPWPTLTLATLATLADPVITPRLLPAGIGLGPIGLSEPLLAVAGAVIAVNAIRGGRLLAALRDPVTYLAIGFVALAVLSAILNAVPPVVALLGIVMTVDAIAVYLVARMLPDAERGSSIAVIGVVGVAVAVSLFGIAQVVLDPNLLGFFSFEGRFGEGGRITSFLGNPNMVAAVIGLSLPFPLFAARHLERRRDRWIAGAALFLIALALLLTFSRGAWLAVGLGAVIGALLVDWRSLGILAVCLALAWVTASVMPRNLALSDPGSADGPAPPPPVVPDLIGSTVDRFGNVGGEGELRMRFIRDGLPIIQDHLLLGVGPGRYGGAAASIITSPVYEEYDASLFGFRTVHNFWLHLLGESGALGTAMFLVLVLGLLVRFVPETRTATGMRFVVLAGAATMLLIAGFNSLTEMIFEGNMPVLMVWLVVGAASLLAPVRPLAWWGSRRA